MHKTYSQAGQDLWVLDKIGRLGYFVDVGAYDGSTISNTLALEEEGWDGLLVEADAGHEIALKRRKSAYTICAVSDLDTTVLFQSGGLTAKIADVGSTVVCKTLKTIFAEFRVPPRIDYLSLDIEGYEYQALIGFPWDTHSAKLVTVEHNLYNGGDCACDKERIFCIMSKNGYSRVQNNVEWSPGNPFEDWYENMSF
jgi:FkbM family methyltransferase